LISIIKELDSAGAKIAAIPCNTAHASPIFDVIKKEIEKSNLSLKLLHLVEETAKFIKNNYPNLKVGVLSTTGTRDTTLYKTILTEYEIENIAPDDELQTVVHEAIYNETYGIKAFSSPVKKKAQKDLTHAISILKNQGAQVIVLACTELPLALTEKTYFGLPTIDPNRVLARALILQAAPEKLKPL
jgi:aspartate racemase